MVIKFYDKQLKEEIRVRIKNVSIKKAKRIKTVFEKGNYREVIELVAKIKNREEMYED